MRRFTLSVPILSLLAFAGNANATLNVTVTNSPYNATGNGMTNDRVAIQNAINDVNAAGGGVVTLPSNKIFLSGNLRLKSNVTLTISGTLLQSQNASHYDYSGYTITTPALGHNMNTGVIWDVASHLNLPFIWGPSGTTNVTINGSGTIQMTTGADNDHTIQSAVIGFYRVNTFTIADVHILGSHMVHVPLNTCTNGTVTRLTINSPHYSEWNDDGVIMQNCENMRVTECDINTLDDAVQVWSSYKDPRGAGNLHRWWSTDSPQASLNIEIDHNTITGHGGMFAPWGQAPDDNTVVDMGFINVHDNTFGTSTADGLTVFSWSDNAFHGQVPYTGNEFDPSPMHDITFTNNVYSSGATWLDNTRLPTTGLLNSGTNFNVDFQLKANDLNGDRRSDMVIWHFDPNNSAWNQVAVHYLNGVNYISGDVLGTAWAGWRATGNADINGDNKSDVLMQYDPNGYLGWWTTPVPNPPVSNNPPNWVYFNTNGWDLTDPNWRVVGYGPLRPGHADMLLLNRSTNNVAVFQMNRTTYTGCVGSFSNANTSCGDGGWNTGGGWRVIATGDLDLDQDADVVWYRDGDGALAIWYMDLANRSFSNANPSNAGSGYLPVASGDFDGDGRMDLVFQNSSGSVKVGYAQSGTSAFNWVSAGIYAGFNVVGAGDYNGDGKSDLLLRNPSTLLIGQVLTVGGTNTLVIMNNPYNANGTGDLNAWQLPENGAPIPLNYP